MFNKSNLTGINQKSEVFTSKTMKKLVSFSTFLTAIIASGLLAMPTRSNSIEQEGASAIASSSDVTWNIPTSNIKLSNETINLASISSIGDRDFLDVSNNNNSTDNINKIIGITGLGLGTGVIVYHLSRAYKPSLANSLPHSNTDTLLLDRVSPKLRQKLLRLVHNRQTANRLLRGTMLSHADRSPNWLAEKVIYDLERDRL